MALDMRGQHGDRRTTADVCADFADLRSRTVRDVHAYDEAAAKGIWGRSLSWTEGQAVVSALRDHRLLFRIPGMCLVTRDEGSRFGKVD